jgi:uncharacterized DUF497 family protein
MRFHWDPAKRLENLRRHGLDFVDAKRVLLGSTLTIPDDRFEYGEARFITFGLLDDRVVCIVHTETADAIRVISMRKATRREAQEFFRRVEN